MVLPRVPAPADLDFLMPHMTYVRFMHANIERTIEVSKDNLVKALDVADTSQFVPEDGMNGTNYRVIGPSVETKDNLIRKGRDWGYTYHGKNSRDQLNYILLGFHIWLSRQPCTDKACGSDLHKCERVEELVEEPTTPKATTESADAVKTADPAPTEDKSPPVLASDATATSRVGDDDEAQDVARPEEASEEKDASPFDEDDDGPVREHELTPPAQAEKATRYRASLDSSNRTPQLVHERPDGTRTMVQGSDDLVRHLAQLLFGRQRVVEVPLLNVKLVAAFIVSCGARGTGKTEVFRQFASWRPGAVPKEQPDYNRYVNAWRTITEGGKLADAIADFGHVLTWPERPVKGGKMSHLRTPDGDERCVAVPKATAAAKQEKSA